MDPQVLFILKVLSAVLFGGIIGWERHHEKKAVGIRTFVIVTVALTVLVHFAIETFSSDSSSRIIQGVLTGIGFLGAGAIIRSDEKVRGVTTAASIYASSIISILLGSAHFIEATTVALVVVIFLFVKEEQFD